MANAKGMRRLEATSATLYTRGAARAKAELEEGESRQHGAGIRTNLLKAG